MPIILPIVYLRTIRMMEMVNFSEKPVATTIRHRTRTHEDRSPVSYMEIDQMLLQSLSYTIATGISPHTRMATET